MYYTSVDYPSRPARRSVPKSQSAPASEKQIAFIAKLSAELGHDTAELDAYVGAHGLTKALASTFIESLLEQSRAAKKAKTDGAVPEGYHFLDGDFYKVQTSQTGNKYAKRFDAAVKSWEYVGRAPLRNLSQDTILTAEQAAEFGHLYGTCVYCGRDLTDERSIEVGYGPVCAKKHDLPWG